MRLGERDRARLEGTLVVDEYGRPRRVFHGTCLDFAGFDERKADPTALYGPGFYFTEDPGIASEYATKGCKWTFVFSRRKVAAVIGERLRAKAQQVESEPGDPRWGKLGDPAARAEDLRELALELAYELEVYEERHADMKLVQAGWYVQIDDVAYLGSPNVRVAYLAIRRPLAIDASFPEDIAVALIEQITGRAFPMEMPSSEVEGELIYRAAVAQAYADVRPSMSRDELATAVQEAAAKQLVREWLERAGFDGITHMGGRITGDRDHRVWIAFATDQIVPL